MPGHVTASERADTEALVAHGRETFGVTGRFEYGRLREALAAFGVPGSSVVLLALAGAPALATVVVLPVMGPDVVVTTGASVAGQASVLALLAAAVGGLIAARLVPRWVAASRVVTAGAVLGTLALLLAARAAGTWGFVAAAVTGGSAAGLGFATHVPLLVDTYPPAVRVRMLSGYGLFSLLGAGVALIVAAGAGPLSWRSRLLLLALVGLAGIGASLTLREPEPGRCDARRLVADIRRGRGGLGSHTGELTSGDARISLAEHVWSVLRVPTAVPMLLLSAASGLVLLTVPAVVPALWMSRFGVTRTHSVEVLGAAVAVGASGLVLFARRGEIAFRASPVRLLRLAGWSVTVATVVLAGTFLAPAFWLQAAGIATAGTFLSVAVPCAAAVLMVTVPVGARAVAGVALGVAVIGGGLVGTQTVSGFGSRFGLQWGLLAAAALLVPVLARLPRAAQHVEADLATTVRQVVDATDLEVAVSQGRRVPLLSCHGIDFSYGQLQVLFGVDFTLDDGEMVALLGTNGAGKSTLLRAISGVGRVSRGTVHYRGTDITYLGYDRRVRLGITQIPGGRAVFGAMSVADNLRAFGYTHGRDRKSIDAGLEVAFDTFPRLAERRHQLASTLSGGEQQMLGLSKAVILRPRVLLIDELSLGLAPKIVGQLLEMVRRINSRGTAVVLVEQSVNVALSLVEHAYFMEKGEMRFDGSAQGLLARPDLLRAVFLQGASAGVA